ncbi:hypothetical protein MMC27_006409 [Xylographa pallens]|nr:hypothetical protein [Xylographa pallens]
MNLKKLTTTDSPDYARHFGDRIGFAKEVGVQSYIATPLTVAITTPALEEAMKICLTFFEKIHEDKQVMNKLNAFMKVVRSTRKFWADWFPVEKVLLTDLTDSGDDVLMVDIGGGNGHDLETFLARFPQSHGHLILQDLPGTISNLKGLGEGIKAMSYDFFLPQPVKGARVYFTHFVMHNWPDDKCREMLCNLMSAMKPGYSKIVLNETVLPDINCPPWFATNDIDMMAILAGLQRSRAQWVDLLRSVDLEVEDIWSSPDSEDSEGVIVAMLKM